MTGFDVGVFAAKVGAEFAESGWSVGVSPNSAGARLVHPDGRALSFRVPGYGKDRGRVVISGVYPLGPGGVSLGREFSVTVAADRRPVDVARYVERRLLPDYDPEFARAVELATSLERAECARRAAMRSLLGVLPGAVEYLEGAANWYASPRTAGLGLRGNFGVVGGSPVRVSLSVQGLSLSQALEMAVLLAGMDDEGDV